MVEAPDCRRSRRFRDGGDDADGSLMNGIGLRGGASPEVQQRQAERLSEFAGGDWRSKGWRDHEYRLMAARFDPDADVPLQEWQQAWPPGLTASQAAFARLFGPAYPLGAK